MRRIIVRLLVYRDQILETYYCNGLTKLKKHNFKGTPSFEDIFKSN